MLRRAERFFLRANQALVGAMMAVMFALVFINVVTRYGFGFSIAWAEEISSVLMIWVAYLGAGLALRQGRHVAIDLFQDMLPQRWRPWARAAVGAVILLFLGFLAFYGFQFAAFGMAQELPMTGIPRGVPYLAVPLGALVFSIHLVLVFRGFVGRHWEAGLDHDEQAAGEA